MTHPAQKFGHWIKAKRQESGIVMRVFAGRIALSAAQYAEVEAGVVKWMAAGQEKLVIEVLSLPPDDIATMKKLLIAAREASPLELRDIYTPEQLEPLRTRFNNKSRLTGKARTALLDAVFRPLT